MCNLFTCCVQAIKNSLSKQTVSSIVVIPNWGRIGFDGEEELYRFLLRALSTAENGIGRGQLCRLAEQEGLLLTDQAVRDALQALNRLCLISVSRGRGGSRLTLRGRQLAEAFSK